MLLYAWCAEGTICTHPAIETRCCVATWPLLLLVNPAATGPHPALPTPPRLPPCSLDLLIHRRLGVLRVVHPATGFDSIRRTRQSCAALLEWAEAHARRVAGVSAPHQPRHCQRRVACTTRPTWRRSAPALGHSARPCCWWSEARAPPCGRAQGWQGRLACLATTMPVPCRMVISCRRVLGAATAAALRPPCRSTRPYAASAGGLVA